MKKRLLLFSLSFFCLFYSRAQNLNAYVTSDAGSVIFQYSCVPFNCPQNKDWVKTENPPSIIPGGWRSYFLLDGKGSAVASSPLDMINNNTIDFRTNGTLPAEATTMDGCTGANLFPWRRNYYGITSAHYVNHPTAGTISLGFIHGEDRSFIGVNQPPVGCDDGTGYPAYAAFVGAAWTPNNQGTNWGQQYFTDIGPVVWPSAGYLLPNGQKSSLGCAEPAAIQADDGYMYVFYKDMSGYVVPPYGSYPGDPSFDPGPGRRGGMKLARVPIGDVLNPQAYTSFYEDAGGIHWNPSLPAGFTKENMTPYFRSQGPQATAVLDNGALHHDYTKFSVAKVAGTNYYFGVGLYQDYNDGIKWKMGLWYSYDLMHWFGERVLYATSNDFNTVHFDYPIFLSSDGWSNTSISANDFYIVGTAGQGNGNTVYRMHVYIPAPPPPPPPPPPPCNGNLNYQKCPAAQTGEAAEMTALELDESTGAAPGVSPNPGRGVYQLSYMLKDHAVTQLNVFDMTGRRLQAGPATLRTPGRVRETVDISREAKGMYLLELTVNGGKKTFKIIYQ